MSAVQLLILFRDRSYLDDNLRNKSTTLLLNYHFVNIKVSLFSRPNCAKHYFHQNDNIVCPN